MDVETLIQAIDKLPPDEFEQVLQHVTQRRKGVYPPAIQESPEMRLAKLQEAFAEMREGMTQSELDKMVDTLNSEYVDPDDLDDEDWVKDDETA